MPDNDQFVRVSRSARVVFKVSGLATGAQLVEVDRTALAIWIEKLIAACDGLPSFGAVVAAVGVLNEEPLFAGTQRICDRVLDAIESTNDSTPQSPLDLVLRRAATREVLDGRYEQKNLAERFFRDVIARYAIDAKGGLVAQISPEALSRERGRLEQDMLPVVRRAAEQLVKSPTLRRLRLASQFRGEGDIATSDLSMEGFSYAASP